MDIFYFIFERLCRFTPCIILGYILFGCEDFIQRFLMTQFKEAELKGLKISDLILTILSFLSARKLQRNDLCLHGKNCCNS